MKSHNHLDSWAIMVPLILMIYAWISLLDYITVQDKWWTKVWSVCWSHFSDWSIYKEKPKLVFRHYRERRLCCFHHFSLIYDQKPQMLCGCVCINGVLPIQSLCTNHISFKHSALAPPKSIGYLGHIISIWSRLHKHFTQTQFSLLHYSILDSLICQSVRQGTVNFWNSCPEFSRLDIKHPQTSEICAVTHAFCYI